MTKRKHAAEAKPCKAAKPRIKRRGRPSLKTVEALDAVLQGLTNGTPLEVLCRHAREVDPTFPAARTVRDWEADPQIAAAIARAREEGEVRLAWECKTIADTPAEGVIEKWEPVEIDNPDDPDLPKVTELRLTERKVEDMLGHRKLQIDTRLKLLAKFNPKRWGDKVDMTHSGGVTMTLAHIIAASGLKVPGIAPSTILGQLPDESND